MSKVNFQAHFLKTNCKISEKIRYLIILGVSNAYLIHPPCNILIISVIHLIDTSR